MMRSHLIWCIVVNILAVLLSIGMLYLYPAGSGFYVHLRNDNTFCSGWASTGCPVDDLRIGCLRFNAK